MQDGDNANSLAQIRFDQLRTWLAARMTDLDIPGAALGVIHGEDVRTAGLGVTDHQSNTPVGTSTAFRIASLTKVFTATALTSLVDDENRQLPAPISSWYPPFAVADASATSAATMEHLLSHSAGWADIPMPETEAEAKEYSLDQAVADMRAAPQLAPPGALFNYSNSSYLLAGQILATICGTTYEEAIANLILAPLGMEQTGFDRERFGDLIVAPGHVTGETGLEPTDPWAIPRFGHPAGGLLSTVDDLVRFVGLHAGTVHPDASTLADDRLCLMQQPHGPGGSIGLATVDAVGQGWMRMDIGGRTVAMSFGSDSGLAAVMAVVPGERFGLVVLTNSDPGLQAATEAIFNALNLYFDEHPAATAPTTLTPADMAALAGRYSIPGDFSFEITATERDVKIDVFAGEHHIPDLSGHLQMLSTSSGTMELRNMPILIDFVHDEDGNVGWLRFFARLAAREH